jgi:cell wall-associated NlpC family hydrolase
MAGQFPHDIGGVPTLIAQQIADGTSSPNPPPVFDLAEAVQEVTIRTQIEGSSFIDVTLIDPQYRFINHGFLNLVQSGNEAGLLEAIQVEFPVNSGTFWVLTAADLATDQSDANITLTFEDRIIWELRQYWGATTPRKTNVLQFIQSLVNECKKPPTGESAGWQQIDFVCPELKISVDDSKPAKTPALRNRNKESGVDASMPTDTTLTKDQADNIAVAIKIAKQLNAPLLAVQALLCAGFGESGWRSGQSNGTYGGVLGGSLSIFPNTSDPGPEVSSFLVGGNGYQQGGAIAIANSVAKHGGDSSPGYIALVVEGSDVPGTKQAWGDGGNIAAGTAYYGKFLDQANDILQHSGAYVALAAASKASGDPAAASWNPNLTLQRGGVANPGEDSWDCIQRVLQANPPSAPGLPIGDGTTWSAFSNGDAFYLMDGHDMIAQKPAAYVDPANNVWWATSSLTSGNRDKYDTSKHVGDVLSLTGTWDNTAFIYASTKTHKGKVSRKSRVSKPSTPTELTLELVCGIDEFRAGQVVHIMNFGPATGKWIITDATRNCMGDTFTTFTLQPPTDQNDSSTVTAVHANSPVGSTSTNGLAAAATGDNASSPASAAMRALAEKSKFTYPLNDSVNARPMPFSLFGTQQVAGFGVPFTVDCSAFVTLCYKAAGWADPNGPAYNYNGQGYTGTLAANSDKVTEPQINDLCLYGAAPDYEHVTIYVGNGMVVSMGQEGDPVLLPYNYRSDFVAYFRPRNSISRFGAVTASGKPAPFSVTQSPFPQSGKDNVTPAPGYNKKPKQPAASPVTVGVSSSSAIAAAKAAGQPVIGG